MVVISNMHKKDAVSFGIRQAPHQDEHQVSIYSEGDTIQLSFSLLQLIALRRQLNSHLVASLQTDIITPKQNGK